MHYITHESFSTLVSCSSTQYYEFIERINLLFSLIISTQHKIQKTHNLNSDYANNISKLWVNMQFNSNGQSSQFPFPSTKVTW